MRKLTSRRLVVASHNPGKVREIADLIAPFDIEAISAAALGLAEPEEPEPTFTGNALIKAHAAAKASSIPALSDDSGLCVDALGGDPGVLSARWAGASKDFALAMRKVHERLALLPSASPLEGEAGTPRSGVTVGGMSRHSAHFVCALAVAWPDGHAEVFEGKVHGHLVWPARGTKGFGYDPIFVPEGHDITFGEMDPAKKHAMSHRARAFAKFVEACLE
ncbi:MAG: non-canonical purine NTP pyrophosphatase [Alphaproteobacteria bacterium]|nr:non-canonical purine NTP pyrophosphatase [Alphaproteobacteria bacterium]